MTSQQHDQAVAQSQPSQSWASWLLDSYASSVSPSEDPSYNESDESHDTTSATSNPSPTSPDHGGGGGGGGPVSHGKSGWGGSIQEGNVQTQNIRAHRRQSSLSERQKAAASAELDTSSTIPQKKPETMRRKNKPEYLTIVGRGGSGNYQSPDLLSPRSPSLPAPMPSPRRSATMPLPSPVTRAASFGRGGAGNYVSAKSAAEAEKTLDLERQQLEVQKTREKVEAEVNQFLQPPRGAWVKIGRERSRDVEGEE